SYPWRAGAQTPETTPAADAAEAPPPEYPPPSTRWKVAGVGLGATAVFYGAGVGASYLFPDTPGMTDLRKPVIGPWVAISHNQCADTDTSCGTVLLVARAF